MVENPLLDRYQVYVRMTDSHSLDGIFDLPQRQSSVGILVEAGYIIYKLLKAFWVVILYLFIRPVNIQASYLWMVVTGLLLLICIIGYFSYRNFLFYIDKQRGEFVLQQGVLTRKRTVFQLEKIQQVNVSQSLIQKLTNVYGVEIETAGSARSEAQIKAVSYAVAQALRRHLLKESSDRGRQEEKPMHGEGDAPKPVDIPFVELSMGSLFKMGVTSKYVESFFILLAFFFGIYNNIRDFLQFNGEDEGRVDAFLSSFILVNIVGTVIVGLILLTILFNLLRTMITYFGFSIRKTVRGLSFSYGLLTSRNVLLYPQKVQMLVMVSNYFQRKMDLSWITIRQASAVERSNVTSNVQIPGSSEVESAKIMRFVFGRVPEQGTSLVPNYRKLIVEGTLFVVIPFLAYVIFVVLSGFEWMGLLVVSLYGALAVMLIWIGYRRSKLFVTDDFVVRQYGVWDIKTLIIEPHKIQNITTFQYFWQKRANVGHVSIQTASGKIVFRFGAFDQIEYHVNRWLYQVETTKKAWM